MIRWYAATREQREAVLRALREALEREEDVVLALVFGGFVQRERFRDIDVAVFIGRELGYAEAAAYAEELAAKLSRVAGYPVDVVVLNHSPAWIRKSALRGVPICVKDPTIFAALWLSAVDEEELLGMLTEESWNMT